MAPAAAALNLLLHLRFLPCFTSAVDYTRDMKIGKLCTIGASKGVVITRDHLEQLGWFKGDQLQQVVIGNELVIRNLTERSVRPVVTAKEWGDGKLRGARTV